MTEIQIEIKRIEQDLMYQVSLGKTIDVPMLNRLCELRVKRAEELAAQHKAILSDINHRKDIMQTHTRGMTAKLSIIMTDEVMALHAGDLSKIQLLMDDYDRAANRWVNVDSCDWPDSEPASVMASILIIANEIC